MSYLSNFFPLIDLQIGEAFGDDSIHSVINLINKLIDFDESKDSMRLVVKFGVMEGLDELKRTYEGLGDFLVTNLIKNH